MMRQTQFALIALLGAISQSAQAINFVFDYSGDAPDEGFFDPTLGEARRTAMAYAGSIWGDLIRSSYPAETIVVRATFDPNPATTLGSANSAFYSANFSTSSPQFRSNTYYPQSLANHLFGADGTPNQHEINITFNSNYGPGGTFSSTPYYYKSDTELPGNQFDFISVAVHEIGHGLGFSDSFQPNGAVGVNADGTIIPGEDTGLPKIYDRFIAVGTGGTLLLSQSQNMRASSIVGDNLFWSGAAATAGNSNMLPKLYAPNPYDGGSSVGHLDAETFPDDLMSPFLSMGRIGRNPSAVDRGMLADMGWSISVTSENVAWSGAGANTSALNPANWASQVPLSGDVVNFGSSPQTNISFDLSMGMADSFNFDASAPSYVLNMRPGTRTRFTGAGVTNLSTSPQTFVLEQGEVAAYMAFENASSPGSATFKLAGGSTSIGGSSPMNFFVRSNAGRIAFKDNASATDGTFNVEGGSGNGGNHGSVEFAGSATADTAEFNNKGGRSGLSLPIGTTQAGFGGQTVFRESSVAGTAHFRNYPVEDGLLGSGGYTTFADSTSADRAMIENFGAAFNRGESGVTEFTETSTADSATITNYASASSIASGVSAGRTSFFDAASASNATITNKGGAGATLTAGITSFFEHSTAGNGTFINEGSVYGSLPYAGTTNFHGNSTAGTATFHNQPLGGATIFRDNSSADHGRLIIESTTTIFRAGGVAFYDHATAGNAEFQVQPLAYLGRIYFFENSSAENATFTLSDNNGDTRIEFWASSRAEDAQFDIGSTGRLYAYESASFENVTVRLRAGALGIMSGLLFSPTPTMTMGTSNLTVDGATVAAGASAQLTIGFNSTADSAVITTKGGDVAGAAGGRTMFDGGRGGNSTLIATSGVSGAQGGQIILFRGANADSARVVMEAGTLFNISGNRDYGITDTGSIEGAGTFLLSGSELRTGSRNLNTVVSGPIVDVQSISLGGKLTKVGSGTLTLAGTNTYTGLTKVDAGTLVVNGSLVGDVTVNSGGTLTGTGSIGGLVTINTGGLLAPGTSSGTITVGGLMMSPGSTLNFELGNPLRDHIVLTNNGIVSLGGALHVTVPDGLVPTLGQSFSLFDGAIGLISGAFNEVNMPTINGMTFDIMQSANSLLLEVVEAPFLAGDYNQNGTVDAADYTVWRDHLDSGTSLANDDTPGVDHDDYARWKNNFGQTSSSGLAAKTHAAIPEPATALLLVLAAGSVSNRVRWCACRVAKLVSA